MSCHEDKQIKIFSFLRRGHLQKKKNQIPSEFNEQCHGGGRKVWEGKIIKRKIIVKS